MKSQDSSDKNEGSTDNSHNQTLPGVDLSGSNIPRTKLPEVNFVKATKEHILRKNGVIDSMTFIEVES